MIDGEDDEIDATGSESEGTEGADALAGDQESDLPAEHADDEADDGEQEVAAKGEKASRGENRVQRLANEKKAEKERADRLEGELIEARRQSYARQNEQTEQQQREMLALMTDGERAEWRIKQFEQRHNSERQQERVQIQSMLDKNAFDAKATVNTVYAKHRDAVEAMFQEQLRMGRPVEREILLQLRLGKLALEGQRNPKAKQQAKGRVEAQRVASGGGKGDSSSVRGKAGDSPADRLKDIYI